jgi:hypothetical protein
MELSYAVEQVGVQRKLRRQSQAGRSDYTHQIRDRSIKGVIDNNIVKLADMTDLAARRA